MVTHGLSNIGALLTWMEEEQEYDDNTEERSWILGPHVVCVQINIFTCDQTTQWMKIIFLKCCLTSPRLEENNDSPKSK